MGRVTWYLSVVVTKHHRGCHQVQRGEIVGNMMQSVVLDGNPLNEDEDMRLLACVFLDGNTPDEVILDLMDLVNDVNLI